MTLGVLISLIVLVSTISYVWGVFVGYTIWGKK